jgi:hypothetical protein
MTKDVDKQGGPITAEITSPPLAPFDIHPLWCRIRSFILQKLDKQILSRHKSGMFLICSTN